MKTKLRRLEQFLFYDYTGIETHLAKMAMKGWQIKKITPFYWEYRSIEPQRLRYTVTYFSEASDFNPYPTENQMTFHDYCETAGWQLVTEWAQMQIFCAKRENPTPIETDEAVKLKAIHRSMKKNYLPGSIVLLLLSLFQIILQVHSLYNDPAFFLSTGTALFGIPLWGLLVLYTLTNLTIYGVWYHLSSKVAARGETGIESSSRYRIPQIVYMLLVGITVISVLLSLSSQYFGFMSIWLVAYMALILIVFFIRNALKRAGASKKLNIAITMVSIVILAVALSGIMMGLINWSANTHRFQRTPAETYTTTLPNGTAYTVDIYHDSLPLTVEDLQDVDYDHYSYEWTARESILLARYAARQDALPDGRQTPELHYTIVDVKLPVLFDLCLDEYLDMYEWDEPPEEQRYFQQTDDPAWRADAVYQLYYHEKAMPEYILCWGNRIVNIRFDKMPTAEQITVAFEKLHQISYNSR